MAVNSKINKSKTAIVVRPGSPGRRSRGFPKAPGGPRPSRDLPKAPSTPRHKTEAGWAGVSSGEVRSWGRS